MIRATPLGIAGIANSFASTESDDHGVAFVSRFGKSYGEGVVSDAQHDRALQPIIAQELAGL